MGCASTAGCSAGAATSTDRRPLPRLCSARSAPAKTTPVDCRPTAASSAGVRTISGSPTTTPARPNRPGARSAPWILATTTPVGCAPTVAPSVGDTTIGVRPRHQAEPSFPSVWATSIPAACGLTARWSAGETIRGKWPGLPADPGSRCRCLNQTFLSLRLARETGSPAAYAAAVDWLAGESTTRHHRRAGRVVPVGKRRLASRLRRLRQR